MLGGAALEGTYLSVAKVRQTPLPFCWDRLGAGDSVTPVSSASLLWAVKVHKPEPPVLLHFSKDLCPGHVRICKAGSGHGRCQWMNVWVSSHPGTLTGCQGWF